MGKDFICPRCGNSDNRYIGYLNGKPYCRACIGFHGRKADDAFLVNSKIKLELKYPLSEKQKEISDGVLYALAQKKNVLIHAVTGAGKTELVYHAMESVLKKRGHVGFATPRKDVVIDLLPRIQEAFPLAKTIAVYGEHSSTLEADIIVLTTHQLYRYESYFELLILDEIDAFPYRDNQVLNSFFKKSVKGNYVLLSATPSEKDISKIEKDNGIVLSLYERYHHAPLPEPKIRKTNWINSYFVVYKLLKGFLKEDKPVFIFVPTISIGHRLYSFLSVMLSMGSFVSSEEEGRRLDIEKFKNGDLKYLVTTSILERGVTVKNLQVIVFDADHELYNAAALIQIAGRVGRKIDAKTGDVYFLGQEITNEMKKAKEEIHEYNKKSGLL